MGDYTEWTNVIKYDKPNQMLFHPLLHRRWISIKHLPPSKQLSSQSGPLPLKLLRPVLFVLISSPHRFPSPYPDYRRLGLGRLRSPPRFRPLATHPLSSPHSPPRNPRTVCWAEGPGLGTPGGIARQQTMDGRPIRESPCVRRCRLCQQRKDRARPEFGRMPG